MKKIITALLSAAFMLLLQVPFTVLAEETASTDIRADLLSPDTLPDGKVDIKYTKQFYFDYSQFNNGFMAYSWSIPEDEIPPGLELGGQYSTWQPTLMGTPTKAGTYTFTIEGARTDYKNGQNVRTIAARKTYTLTILPNPLEISANILFNGNEGSSYWSKVYEKGSRTVTWSMTLADGTALPDGLSINSENGEINWATPTAGKYNLKITAASTSKGESTSKVLKLIIEPGDGCKHTSPTRTERKHATCKENGMADYWYCDVCEGYFLDAECTRSTSSDSLDKLYTIGFHTDENEDGKCDTCQKNMPIFKKVTNEDEITSCGMYLVVAKIGDKDYTFKISDGKYSLGNIEAVEITKNADGTFSYPASDSGVMILKTAFVAECGSLDAGKPRYGISTTIDGIPYSLTSDDYSGYVYMYSYEGAKYGYRMKLTDDTYVQIASVYAEYWSDGDSGKSGNSSILTAFEGTKDGEPKRFFSLTTKEAYESEGIYTGYEDNYFYDTDSLSTYPVELYKLTYTGEVNGQSYSLSDGQCLVTIGSEVTVLDSAESKTASTVGGISEAVKKSYVESVVSGQTVVTGNATVTTYAAISLMSGETTENKWGGTDISSLVYEVTPKIEVKGVASEETYTQQIPDDRLDGFEITVTLCVGDMYPAQIIHHKTDGTKEYFYKESSKELKAGQKTFSIDDGYEKGNFVTFTIDSFSKIEILATAKEEPITVGNATVPVPVGGMTPTFTAVSDDPSRYSVELLKWVDVENNMDFNKQDLTNINSPYYNYKFEAGKKYEVQVRFTAADGYELSYNNNFTINGEKTWWRGDGLIRTYVFVPNTDTVADKNENKFTVTGYNIDGCTVILALYKEDSQGNRQLAECKTAVYDGEPIKFTVTASDYTEAKVMVWDELTSLKPVTEEELVILGK